MILTSLFTCQHSIVLDLLFIYLVLFLEGNVPTVILYSVDIELSPPFVRKVTWFNAKHSCLLLLLNFFAGSWSALCELRLWKMVDFGHWKYSVVSNSTIQTCSHTVQYKHVFIQYNINMFSHSAIQTRSHTVQYKHVLTQYNINMFSHSTI